MLTHDDLIRQITLEQRKRRRDSLRLFEPTDYQKSFFASNVQTRIASGGNQSGKSTVTAIEFAAFCRRLPILDEAGNVVSSKHEKWNKEENLLCWVIGLGEDHLASVVYDKLFAPGAFKVVKDPVTKKLRAWRGHITPEESELEKKAEPAPPLIPESEVKSWGWKDKKIHLLHSVELKNGTTIRFYTSKGDVKQGDQVHYIWIDEDIEYPEYLSEWYARIGSKDGFLTWSSWPRINNPALMQMKKRARIEQREIDDEALAEKDRSVTWHQFRYSLNPFWSDEQKRKTINNWRSQGGEDEVRARDLGEFVTETVLVYPAFTPELHCIERLGEEPGLPENFAKLHKTLARNAWEPPVDWTRYMILDPGHSYAALLFVATPPPQEFGDYRVVYNELYLRHKTASEVAKLMAPHCERKVFEKFIIDRRYGRQSAAGTGMTFRQIFSNAFRARNIESVSTHSSFAYSNDDVQAGLLAVREAMAIRADGTPQLILVGSKTPNLIDEIQDYRKHVTKSEAEDKPASGQRDHLCDTLRYAMLDGCKFVPVVTDPPLQKSPAMVAFEELMQPQRDSAHPSVFMGPGAAV